MIKAAKQLVLILAPYNHRERKMIFDAACKIIKAANAKKRKTELERKTKGEAK